MFTNEMKGEEGSCVQAMFVDDMVEIGKEEEVKKYHSIKW